VASADAVRRQIQLELTESVLVCGSQNRFPKLALKRAGNWNWSSKNRFAVGPRSGARRLRRFAGGLCSCRGDEAERPFTKSAEYPSPHVGGYLPETEWLQSGEELCGY